MDHNIDTYNEAMRLINEHGKVVVVQPTGTGKSYIAMQMMIDFGKCKKIVVAPSRDFLDIMERNKYWDKENTITLTYSWITTHRGDIAEAIKDIVDVNEVGLIIADEVHRAAAKYWSVALQELMDICINAKMLGLTATPHRQADNIDIIDTLFNGISVSNKSLYDVISSNILQKLYYVINVSDGDKELRKLLLKYDKHRFVINKLNDEISAFKEKWNTEHSFEYTLSKYLVPDGSQPGLESKHIVFVQSIADIPKNVELVKEYFSKIYAGYNINVMYVHSNRPKKENSEAIAEFAGKIPENTIQVMIAVQMINESFHFEGVKSISMLRCTQATNVFMQQIGRALSADGEMPYIFDFVDNFDVVGRLAVLAGGKDTSVNIYDIFEEFKDETEACREDLDKLKNKIENRIVYFNNSLVPMIKKYGTLQEIPEPKFRDWAVQQFRQLRLDKHRIYVKHTEDFELTNFVDMVAGTLWLQRYRKMDKLTDEEQKEFINITLKCEICTELPIEVYNKIKEQLHIDIKSMITLDMLREIIKNSNDYDARQIRYVMDYFDAGDYFMAFHYKCGFANRSIATAPRVYRMQDLEKASARYIWEMIQTDPKLTKIKNLELHSIEYSIYQCLKTAKECRNVHINAEEFKVINTEIITDEGFENRSELFKLMMQHFNLKTPYDLAKRLDKIIIAKANSDSILNSCISIIDKHNNDSRNKADLIDEVERYISTYDKEWLHGYFKETVDDFKHNVLPFVTYVINDNTYMPVEDAKQIVDSYFKNRDINRAQDKALKNTKGTRKTAMMLLNKMLKKHNIVVDDNTVEEKIQAYVDIIREKLYAIAKTKIESKRAMASTDSSDIRLMILLFDAYSNGVDSYRGITKITEDDELVATLIISLLRAETRQKIINTIKSMNKGLSFRRAAAKAKLYNNLTYREEETLYSFTNSGLVNSETTFYFVATNISLLDTETSFTEEMLNEVRCAV